MTLKEKLKQFVEDKDTFDFYEMVSNISNWPKIFEKEYDDEGNLTDSNELEDLDLENYRVVCLTNERLVLECGGDWQDPHTVIITIVNDRLIVSDYYKDEEIEDEGFIELLNK